MSKQIIISVMSKDRPGIIADVTGAIYELNGDLADLNQSILHDYLTMILIATFSEQVTPEDVLARLSHIQSQEKLEILIREMDHPIELSGQPESNNTYIVTAQGKNKSGLVYSISHFCHKQNINIQDLTTTLADNMYTMVLKLDLSNIKSLDDLRRDLDKFARKTGLNVTMQHNNIFQATHEVTLH